MKIGPVKAMHIQVDGSKKGKPKKKEVLECDIIARGLQRLNAQDREIERLNAQDRLSKPADPCARGKSAGLQK